MLTAPRRTVQRPIQLLDGQARFMYSEALYRAAHAGIGGGKSWVLGLDLFSRARPGRTYMLAAPTYRTLMRSTLKSVQKLNRTCPFIRRFRKADMVLELRNGAEVLLASADVPDSLRGPNLSGAALDEASLMEEEAYDVSIGRLREEGEQGWLSAAFTPKGQTHWTFTRFGQPQPDTDVFTWETGDNYFLPEHFADTLAKQYVGPWRDQELGGRFMAMEGAEFPPEWFGSGIWFDDWPPASEVLLRIVSLDPSKGKAARLREEGKPGDYSAFAIIYLTRDGTIWVDADLDNRRPTTRIVTDGIELYRQHVPDAFCCEINQFQELLAKDFLREAAAQKLILPMYGWNNQVNKEVRIRRLAPMLAGVDGRMRFKRTRGMQIGVAQLQDFRAPPHPPHYHDDFPDALEMGIRMLLHIMTGGRADAPGAPIPMGRLAA